MSNVVDPHAGKTPQYERTVEAIHKYEAVRLENEELKAKLARVLAMQESLSMRILDVQCALNALASRLNSFLSER